jgi:hypothetical protein
VKLTAVSILVGAFSIMLSAHDVFSTKITWSREISRTVLKRCGSCHRDGGSSFALTTFEEARPWAKAIKEEVLERRMPPYAAIKGFGDLRDDHALTQDEIHLISDWVEGGSPEGDKSLLPKNPEIGPGPTRGMKASSEVMVNGSLTLKQPMTFVGIRPRNLNDGSSIKVVADRPDGTIEPLIWLYDYKAKFAQPYYFRAPIQLPAGTKIETYPRGIGTLSFLAAK